MRDPKKEKQSKKELKKMLASLSSKDYFESFWRLGKFQATKTLADGTRIVFSVTEPQHARPRAGKAKTTITTATSRQPKKPELAKTKPNGTVTPN